MNKKLLKIITVILSFVLTLSCMTACKEEIPVAMPDYSQSGKSFNIFTYNGPTDGKNNYDGVIVEYGDTDENGNVVGFRTVERYKEYKAVGFDTLFLTGTATLGDVSLWGNTEKCEAYKCCVNAYEAGIEKIILDDALFELLITKSDLLVGDKDSSSSYIYDDEDANGDGISDELYADVYNELKVFCYQPGVYGTRLGDEPKYTYAVSYGKVYRAIKAAIKQLYEEGLANGETEGIMKHGGDFYIHLNLAPVGFPGLSSYYAEPYVDETTGKEYYTTYEDSYRRYVELFIKESGCDRLSVDIYAFRDSKIYSGYYANLQIFKEVCDQYGVDMTVVLQSFNQYSGKTLNYDTVSDAEMNMEMYSAIAMGATNLAYFTYMSSTNFSATGIKTLDNSCFLTRQGEKNEIYYYGQKLISDVRKFENVVLNYAYQGSKIYTAEVATFNNSPYLISNADPRCTEEQSMSFDNSHEFKLVKGITFDNDVTLMTELYDETNDLYMYALQNVIDPRNGADGKTEQSYTVDFGDYEWVAEYTNGELRYVELTDGIYSRTLSAGYAVFLVPLK